MRTGTYGLGTSVRSANGGGPGLVDLGAGQQRQAVSMLGNVAEQEVQRGIVNKQARQQQKQGALGLAASGAATGAMVGGPWGAVIGGAVGLLAGGLFG